MTEVHARPEEAPSHWLQSDHEDPLVSPHHEDHMCSESTDGKPLLPSLSALLTPYVTLPFKRINRSLEKEL